jgi:hypothetical protein
LAETKQTDEDSQTSRPGDVETAGETTAADAVEGPADTTPVGAGTTARVEGEAEPTRDE